MPYSREERETTLVFEDETKQWTAYSTVPKHIRKLTEITEVSVLESEGGNPIAVRATLTEKQVSLRKPRVMSEEQRKAAAERLREAQRNK